MGAKKKDGFFVRFNPIYFGFSGGVAGDRSSVGVGGVHGVGDEGGQGEVPRLYHGSIRGQDLYTQLYEARPGTAM